jgi:hypothetical protein
LLVRGGLIAAIGTRAQVEALPESRDAEKFDVGGPRRFAGVRGFAYPPQTTRSALASASSFILAKSSAFLSVPVF